MITHPLVDDGRVGPKQIPLGFVIPRRHPLHLLDRRLDQRVPAPWLERPTVCGVGSGQTWNRRVALRLSASIVLRQIVLPLDNSLQSVHKVHSFLPMMMDDG